MKTALECLPCFLNQAIHTTGLHEMPAARRRQAVKAVAALLPELDFSLSPPENSIRVYEAIAEITGIADPFAAIKRRDNDRALALMDAARRHIDAADDPLRAATLLAIGGNIIDYGSHQQFDLDAALERALALPLPIDDYEVFRERVSQARNILYLADNAGEIAFDRLLIERLDTPVVCAVKGAPIINDALRADAGRCGLDAVCRVIDNGTGCPGTPLPRCAPEFQEIFAAADCVISKGQGNFETLSETAGPIVFLLTVKCPVVGRHITDIDPQRRLAALGACVLLAR